MHCCNEPNRYSHGFVFPFKAFHIRLSVHQTFAWRVLKDTDGYQRLLTGCLNTDAIQHSGKPDHSTLSPEGFGPNDCSLSPAFRSVRYSQ